MPPRKTTTTAKTASKKAARKPRKAAPKKARSTTSKRSRKAAEPVVFIPSEIETSSVAHGYTSHRPAERPLVNRTRERNQRLVMWLSISIIMTAIISVWIMNLNRIVGANAFSSSEPQAPNQDFEELSRNLRETLEEVKTGLQQFEEAASTVTETASPAVISGTAAPATITDTAVPNTLPN